jgi:ARC6-like, IMS domain
MFLVVGFLSLLILWWILSLLGSALQALSGPSGPSLEGEQAMISLETPPIEIPAVPAATAPEPSAPAPVSGTVTEETGGQIIQTWLSAKAAALGPNHAVDELKQVLTEPALSRWQLMAEAQQRNKVHQRYVHSLQVTEVRANPSNPDRAEVEAQVTEKAEVFDGEKQTTSRNENLRVRYELIRQDGQWRIMDWQVMK